MTLIPDPASLIIFGATFVAGIINTIAGGGTLISFPTLVWLGRNPILANASNAAALWPGSFAGMVGF
ncbi:MAG TPA: sulfite exporter TauE/SafE family protein, partial [Thermoanaerobaculia bacterium]